MILTSPSGVSEGHSIPHWDGCRDRGPLTLRVFSNWMVKKLNQSNKCIDYQIYSRKLLLYLQKLNEFHSRILFPNETSITNTTLKEDFSWFCFYSGKVVSDFYNLKPALARLAYFCRTRISSCYLWWLWSPSFITLLVYVGSLEELTVYHSNLYSGKQWLDASGAKKLRNDSQCEIIKHYAAK